MSHAAYLINDISTHSRALSPEDAASLALADPENLQSWASARMQECTSCLLGLKTVYNSGAPINRKLPPEVLLEIFRHLNPSDSPSNRWFHVLHVCRLWRSLIFRIAAFWADELSAPRDLHEMTDTQVTHLKLFMDLARTHPLELSLYGVHNQPAFNAVSLHSDHLAVLHIRLSQNADTVALNSLLEGSLPLLTVLTIQHVDIPGMFTDELVRVCLDVSQLPSLRTLHLPWDTYSISGVNDHCRHLEIFRCLCSRCLNDTTEIDPYFQATLQAFPGLQHLRLYRLPHRHLLIEEHLALPALRTLYLQSDDRSYIHTEEPVRRVLSVLACPTSCLVEILFKTESFRRLLPENLTSFHPVADVDHAEFTYRPENQELQLATSLNGTKMLCMRSVQRLNPPTHSFTDLAKELADVFAPFHKVTSFTLRLSPIFAFYDDKPNFHRLLAGLPHVVRLNVTGHNGINDVLSVLQDACPSGQFLCPFLEELQIEWTFDPGALMPVRWPLWGQTQGLYGTVGSSQEQLSSSREFEVSTAFADAVASMVERRAPHTATLKMLSITVLPDLWLLVRDPNPDPQMILSDRLRSRLQGMVANVTVQPWDGIESVTLLDLPETDDESADSDRTASHDESADSESTASHDDYDEHHGYDSFGWEDEELL